MGKNQHVTQTKDGNWQVKGEGNSRATAVYPTQREARAKAIDIAKKQGSEMLLHGKDGKIRERNTYGKDPFPPKG